LARRIYNPESGSVPSLTRERETRLQTCVAAKIRYNKSNFSHSKIKNSKGGRTMTRGEIEEFFARRDEAWQRHNVAALISDHTDDGEVESPLYGNVKGRKALEEIYSMWYASFPESEYSTEHLLIDGDRAMQIVTMTGVHSGIFCGFAPTGKTFKIRCAFHFLFSEGKIAHEIRIYDFTSLLLQLGVLKAKPAF
jgi:steroid delta-isomerase-like uncharacterized protein